MLDLVSVDKSGIGIDTDSSDFGMLYRPSDKKINTILMTSTPEAYTSNVCLNETGPISPF